MAVFKRTQEDVNRLDYKLLQNSPINLYWRTELFEADAEWLHNNEYTVHTFDCRRWESTDTMYQDFELMLRNTCSNLDGLNDRMYDLEVSQKGGYAICFLHYDFFSRNHPRHAHVVLDIIARQSRFRLGFGERLLALVQSDNPHINFGVIGACYIDWNRQEWLYENRDSSLYRSQQELANKQVVIRAMQPDDVDAYSGLRSTYLSDDAETYYGEINKVLSHLDHEVFVADLDGSVIGFAETSLRDYAEGCSSSPVGYLASWYVSPEYRNQGVGRKLAKAAEAWAKDKGCTEIASDTRAGNHHNYQILEQLGFEEVDCINCFRKTIR